MLRVENDTVMSGKAVYSEGEVPLSLKDLLQRCNSEIIVTSTFLQAF